MRLNSIHEYNIEQEELDLLLPILTRCTCKSCDRCNYIKYITCYKILSTDWVVQIKKVTLLDKTLPLKIMFFKGCPNGSGTPTNKRAVLENLLDSGVSEIIYHINVFK